MNQNGKVDSSCGKHSQENVVQHQLSAEILLLKQVLGASLERSSKEELIHQVLDLIHQLSVMSQKFNVAFGVLDNNGELVGTENCSISNDSTARVLVENLDADADHADQNSEEAESDIRKKSKRSFEEICGTVGPITKQESDQSRQDGKHGMPCNPVDSGKDTKRNMEDELRAKDEEIRNLKQQLLKAQSGKDSAIIGGEYVSKRDYKQSQKVREFLKCELDKKNEGICT